ncbi:hypothetical protein ZOSMA_17G01240 [Zostera marina]|uniref:Protein PAIR1 n=1 Tax=Zostera marina TaxID=29655 RepID=A0A0K9PRG1_ZOSMR|nr:hypothetical protein ZOSMA_17G01240 [Zostera marina]
MRLNINKACDLNSISVLPPQSRKRLSGINPVMDSNVTRMSQPSMLRSQQSQGLSLSQLSQSSFDDILTNDLRLGSEDQSTSKRTNHLVPNTSKREDSLFQLSRPISNNVSRLNIGSASEKRCILSSQINNELEHRIGLMENNLSRLGRILDSVQGDIMQVNKSVKDVALETECIRQKMIVQDNLLQLILKGEEEIKSSLDRSLNCDCQLKTEANERKFHEMSSLISSLPNIIESKTSSLKNEVVETFIKEIQEIKCCLKSTNSIQSVPILLRKNGTGQFQKNQSSKYQMNGSSINYPRKFLATKDVQVGTKKIQNPYPFIEKRQKEQNFSIIIDSDEDIDIGLSCLLGDKRTDLSTSFSEDIKEESMKILRKARRKRKYINTILID